MQRIGAKLPWWVCTCSSFRGDRMDSSWGLYFGVLYPVKKNRFPSDRRIHGFFLPSIDKIIVFRDASTWSPWRIETGFAIRKCELIVFSLLNGIFSFFSSSSILMKAWMLRDSFFFFFKNWLITINFETVWFIDSSKECFKVLFFFKYWFYRCVFKYYRRRKEEFKMKSRIYLKK